MRNRALSSPPIERIGGVSRAGRILASFALLALPSCGGALTAQSPVGASLSKAAPVAGRAGGASEVRLYELPEGYAWNLDRRLTGLSATLDAIKDPSVCGDGIDESWSRLRASLDALDERVRSAPGGLIVPEGPSGVWVQSIEPMDRSIAAYTKQDAKKQGTLGAGISSIRVGADAGAQHTSNASELLLGRQAYEVRLTAEAVACIRLNANLHANFFHGRGRAAPPVWDRIVYGALEQTLVRSSAFDVGGELTAPMLRVKGGLEESQISARVDQLGGHSRENGSSAPEVKRLLTEQRLNELLAQTNQYYDRTAIIAVHEDEGSEGEPMPVLAAAAEEDAAVPPETIVYFANTSDNDLDLWLGSLPRGLCVVSRGGAPIDDEAAVRAAVVRDIGRWFDTGEVRTKGDCAPIRGPKPLRYFVINALSGKSHQVDPNAISQHYHFKVMEGDAAAAEASALAVKAGLTPKQRNLWLLDRLRSGGDSLDAHGVLPQVPGDSAQWLRSEYYEKLLESRYPSASDALRVLRKIVHLRAGKHSQASFRYAERDILSVLAGGASNEYGLRPWWPTAGTDCKLQRHSEGEPGGSAGAWMLFCRGHLLELRNMEVLSSDFPADIASPQLITVSADERAAAPREGEAPSKANPEVYGYILGDLIFVRRNAVHQVLKALGESITKSDSGRVYSIKLGASGGLDWVVEESAVTQVAATEDALLAGAPVYSRCTRRYAQGQLSQLYCTAPQNFEIDHEKLGRSMGLFCQSYGNASTVNCSTRGWPSAVARTSAALSIPLIAIPPPAPPVSEGGGA